MLRCGLHSGIEYTARNVGDKVAGTLDWQSFEDTRPSGQLSDEELAAMPIHVGDCQSFGHL